MTLPICLILMTSVTGNAQRLIQFSSLKTPDSAVVYRGWENRIEVRKSDVISENSSITITSKIGTIDTVYGSCLYKPGSAQTDELILYVDGVEKERITVRVDKLPEPEILLAGRKSGKINRALLMAAPYFVVVLPNFLVPMYGIVRDLRIELKHPDGSKYYKAKGSFLSDDLLHEISITKGDMLLKCDVIFYPPGGCGRSITLFYEIT